MRMLLLAPVLYGLIVAGCDTLAPVVKTEGQEVNTPTAQKCIAKEDLPKSPQFPLDLVDLKVGEELARLTNAARLELKTRREYVKKIDEALKKCAD